MNTTPRGVPGTVRPVPIRVITAALASCALAFGALACGSKASSPTVPVANGRVPALARTPAGAGEVLVRAQASPVARGPYALHGTYRAQFVQYDPTDPTVDFRQQTSFVAALHGPGGKRVPLFRTAAPHGETSITIDGRFTLEVSFGDFPFALRLTPAR